jgi:hypothetical protein
MKYNTNYFDGYLADRFYCAHVACTYVWFETHEDVLAFQKSDSFDFRMTITTPANSHK